MVKIPRQEVRDNSQVVVWSSTRALRGKRAVKKSPKRNEEALLSHQWLFRDAFRGGKAGEITVL
jgi:hypothetical protein